MMITVMAYYRDGNGRTWYQRQLVNETHVVRVLEKHDNANEKTGRTQLELVNGAKLTINRPWDVVVRAFTPELLRLNDGDSLAAWDAAMVMIGAAPVADEAIRAAEEAGQA